MTDHGRIHSGADLPNLVTGPGGGPTSAPGDFGPRGGGGGGRPNPAKKFSPFQFCTNPKSLASPCRIEAYRAYGDPCRTQPLVRPLRGLPQPPGKDITTTYFDAQNPKCTMSPATANADEKARV